MVQNSQNSLKSSQNSLIKNSLDLNQKGDLRLLGREQQEINKTQNHQNHQIDQNHQNHKNSTENENIRHEKLKKLRPQQTRPIIPLRNEKLFYSIDSLNKPKIKPLFKQPLLNMDKPSHFLGIHTSIGQQINQDVNRALESLLIENPERRPKTPERKLKPRGSDSEILQGDFKKVKMSQKWQKWQNDLK